MSDTNSAPYPSDASTEELIPLPTDRLWDVHQAAAYLKRSVSWVYKAAERGELPRARGFGWGLRFVPAELDAYAKGNGPPTADVLPITGKGRRKAGGGA